MKSIAKLFLASVTILTAATACSSSRLPMPGQVSRMRAPVQIQQSAHRPVRMALPTIEAGLAQAEQIARGIAADAVLTDVHNFNNQGFGYLFGAKSISQRIWVGLSAETGQATNIQQMDWDPQGQEKPFFAPIIAEDWKVSSEQALDLVVKNGFADRNDVWMDLSTWFSDLPLKYVIIPESFQGPGFVVRADTGEIWPCESGDNSYSCHGRKITRQMMQASKALLQRRSR